MGKGKTINIDKGNKKYYNKGKECSREEWIEYTMDLARGFFKSSQGQACINKAMGREDIIIKEKDGNNN